MVPEILLKLKNRLVVSCQAEGDSPFNSPEGIAMMALAARQGGAAGLRIEGIEKIKRVKQTNNLPVIGIIKSEFPDGTVRITRSIKEVDALCLAGAEIIAIDGTLRENEGFSGPQLIRYCRKRFPGITILADISTPEEAVHSIEAGADAVSTTLNGYTPWTMPGAKDEIDLDFVQALCKQMKNYPVIAEGKIHTPVMAHQAIQAGAWAVVVGSAITRPHLITEKFAAAIL